MHPILFESGPLVVYSYGFLIAVGGAITSAWWLSKRRQMGLAKDEDGWLVINGILFGGFLGGRLMQLFEYEVPFSPQFWSTAFSMRSGFSVMGSFVGVGVGIWVVCRFVKGSWLRIMDYVTLGAPFWHFFGRLGCLAAGCCFGRPTGLPWAVTFTDPRALTAPELLGVPLHPSQLYEGFLDLFLAAFLYKVVLSRVEGGRLPRGSVCAAEFMGYAVVRFATEPFRADSLPLAGGLTVAQGLSLLLFAVGAGIWLSLRRRRKA